MNGSRLPPARVNQAISSAQSILRSSGVPQAGIQCWALISRPSVSQELRVIRRGLFDSRIRKFSASYEAICLVLHVIAQ